MRLRSVETCNSAESAGVDLHRALKVIVRIAWLQHEYSCSCSYLIGLHHLHPHRNRLRVGGEVCPHITCKFVRSNTRVCSGRSIERTSPPGPAPEVPLSVSDADSGIQVQAAVERRCRTRAGAVYAEMGMSVSGGNVTITKSLAPENGGSGEMGCFLGPRTGDEASSPRSGTQSVMGSAVLGRRVLRVQGLLIAG